MCLTFIEFRPIITLGGRNIMTEPKRVFKACYTCKRTAEELTAAGLRFYSNGYCNECGARKYSESRMRRIDDVRRQHREHYARYRDKKLKEAREQGQRLRRATIEAYGGKCVCCGEAQYEFLAIDHVNGGGNQHKKQLRTNSSASYYRWLRNNGYPADFRILCHNCNLSLGNYGYCPHGGVEPVPLQPRSKAGRKRKAPTQ